MTDPTTPGSPADPPAEDDDDSNPNVALGIVFGMLGLVLMLTLDDTRVAGLPFVILGITFLVMGVRPKKKASGDDVPAAPAPNEGDPR